MGTAPVVHRSDLGAPMAQVHRSRVPVSDLAIKP